MVFGVESKKPVYKKGEKKGQAKPGNKLTKAERQKVVADQIQELEGIVNSALESLSLNIMFDTFYAKSEIVSESNNWKENPNGESYITRLSSRYRPSILERLQDRDGPELKALIQERIKALQETRRPSVEGRTRQTQQTFQLVKAKHYSRVGDLTELNPAYHGTGLPGAEFP